MHETHQLAHEPASVAVARHELRDLLQREGVGESVVYDATLVLSELVSNAVRHGRPTSTGHVEVSWSLEPERLVLEVADGGRDGAVEAVDADPDSDHGRGLMIVGEVCDRWHVDRRDRRTHVVAELALAMA
ncbi:MAG: ATP-binding protein [Actinomycetota bacterium]|nr:ATP-binding protein [Actinomycetota bacterium]MEE3126972.1 ATP-binding protein [Actinomycetota bacterium]